MHNIKTKIDMKNLAVWNNEAIFVTDESLDDDTMDVFPSTCFL